MRLEFVDEVDEKGLFLFEVLRDKLTGEILAKVDVINASGVTLIRSDNSDTKTFPVTNKFEILIGSHSSDLLEFLGKSAKDLVIPSGESQK